MTSILTKKQAQNAINKMAEIDENHYVYGLCRGDTDNVFYIGKGINGRLFEHEKLNGNNPHKNNTIKKHGISGYVLFKSFKDSKDAFDYEIELIAEYGLRNLTNIGRGGEGQDPEFASNFTKGQWVDKNSKIRKATQTKEYKAKLGKLSAERWKTKEYRDKMENAKPASVAKMKKSLKKYYSDHPEVIAEMVRRNTGLKRSDETKLKHSIANKKRWSDNENRIAQSEKLKKASSTPEAKERLAKASNARWAKEGAKEKTSAKGKEVTTVKLAYGKAHNLSWYDANKVPIAICREWYYNQQNL